MHAVDDVVIDDGVPSYDSRSSVASVLVVGMVDVVVVGVIASAVDAVRHRHRHRSKLNRVGMQHLHQSSTVAAVHRRKGDHVIDRDDW